jgi:pimeloyl-ACP methyl ester carboxylesterase
MRKRLVLAVSAVSFVAWLVPIHASGARDADPAVGATPEVQPVHWSPCPSQSGLDCGSVRVPVDYERPHGATLSIAVIRRRASDHAHRRGALLFNPGGPGESGVQLLGVIVSLLPPRISERFDVVGFDERGTGASNRIDCGTSPAAAASVLPVPRRRGGPLPGASVFEDLSERCQTRYRSLLGQINTTNAARDLDVIRADLGEPRIDFLGLSYGTLLGATYAQLFPHRVRSMVLDGAIDPADSLEQEARQEAPALEASLLHFFDACHRDTKCALYPDPRATYEKVKAMLERHALPAPGSGDNTPVTLGDLEAATLVYLSVPSFTGSFPAAVQAAARGDGAPLRQLALLFFEDLDGSSLVDPLWTITCEDQAVHPNAFRAGRLASELNRRYPLIGAYAVTYQLGGCVSWPQSTTPVAPIHAPGAAPIVVIGNTGDPNTPHLWAEHLARTLASGVLVTWQGWGHTWLLNGANDTCMSDLVTAYLMQRKLPASGHTCA